MPDRSVETLRDDQVKAAALALARAFQEDPLQVYAFPDGAERQRLSPPHFEAIVRYGMIAGRVWAAGETVEGVAVCWPPGHGAMNEAAIVDSGLALLPERVGPAAMQRFMAVIDHIEALHQRDVVEPHWYVMVLGVDPEQQGRGCGGQLLRAVFAEADAAGVPCYLETCQPRNVAFYLKQGFELRREGAVPGTPVQYWTFLRRPKS